MTSVAKRSYRLPRKAVKWLKLLTRHTNRHPIWRAWR